MHARYWITAFEGTELLGKFCQDERVEFEADLENVYEEGEIVDFIAVNPRNFRKKDKVG
jgi:hypothetical protein